MEPSGASDKRVSVLECGQSSAAFASRTVLRLRKLPFAIRAFRISPTETVALGIDARRSRAHCQSGRGLPALQDADATAEPLPIFRALPSSSDPNWSLLQPTWAWSPKSSCPRLSIHSVSSTTPWIWLDRAYPSCRARWPQIAVFARRSKSYLLCCQNGLFF